MSKQISIDFLAVYKKTAKAVPHLEILKALINYGWIVCNDGHVYYSIVEDDDYSVHCQMNEKELFNLIEECQKLKKSLFIGVRWKNNPNYGLPTIHFYFSSNCKNPITSLGPDASRMLCVDEQTHTITDVNWYISRIVLACYKQGMVVSYLDYTEF